MLNTRQRPVAPFLALVYGSRAEYNTFMFNLPLGPFGDEPSGCWPEFECVHKQIGSTTKELYVDDTTDASFMAAHTWINAKKAMMTYADGAAISVLCSFLRRHVLGVDEARPAKPGNAFKWEQLPAAGVDV